MDPIKPSSWEYKRLQEYITSTYGSTNRSIGKPMIQHAFRVERPGEGEAWSHGGYDRRGDGERLLLWHGSRSMNFSGAFIPSMPRRYSESRIADHTPRGTHHRVHVRR